MLRVSETDVVELLLQGLSNKDIADKLQIKETTVKCHLYRVYQKLNVNSDRELIAKFYKNELGVINECIERNH
jgi:DNA-binding NarL/FixJ family response regulator